MLHWAYSHKQSLKYLIGVVKNKGGENTGQFVDESYLGLDSKKTPLRIFKHPNAKRTTFILFPGASPFAEEHPGMIGLATTIKNLGYNVFIPRIPPLKALNIGPKNIEWFAHAYDKIINRDNVDVENVAAVGISFGGSLLLKAMLEKKIQNNPPRSLLMYGSCFDFETGLHFLLTGEIEHDGKIAHIPPNDWGMTVLFHNFIKNIDAGFDTTKIEEVLSARVADDLELVEKLKQNLNEHDHTLITDVLNGKINPEIEKISKEIIQSQKEILNELSPSTFCHKISSKVFVMHGANDSMVPYSESIKLGKNLPNNELLISYLYEHKEISTNSGIISKFIEFIKLEHFFASYFRYNER